MKKGFLLEKLKNTDFQNHLVLHPEDEKKSIRKKYPLRKEVEKNLTNERKKGSFHPKANWIYDFSVFLGGILITGEIVFGFVGVLWNC